MKKFNHLETSTSGYMLMCVSEDEADEEKEGKKDDGNDEDDVDEKGSFLFCKATQTSGLLTLLL